MNSKYNGSEAFYNMATFYTFMCFELYIFMYGTEDVRNIKAVPTFRHDPKIQLMLLN